MNLPKFVLELLATKYNEAEVALIDANWHSYASILFGESTKKQILKTAAMVFECVRQFGS